jgi:AraC family transcriptional regulator of adaptative response / DNA-3-methyladenine glycosylase II
VDLIASGELDNGSEVELAARLAVSERHLRRMFRVHIGATPDQLARSRRAHFARRLLDDTDLSVTDIAFAAGFGSLRQFNRVMATTFRAAPHELRRRRRRADRLVADGGLALRVPLSAGARLDRLSHLADRAIGGIESATTTHYRRTVTMDGDPGVIDICSAAPDAVRLVAHIPRIDGLIHLVDQVRRLLAGQPWSRYEGGIRNIVADHAGAAANDVLGRIVAEHGMPIAGLQPFGLTRIFPAPAALATADLHGTGVNDEGAQAIRDYSADQLMSKW